jgi:hypothetical protein
MAALVCDKDELMGWDTGRCLTCFSEKQLLGVIALSLCKIVGGDPNTECAPAVLLEGAACIDCMNPKQKLQALAALILNWGIDNEYIVSETDLRNDIACLLCLPESKIMSIILSLICHGISDGTILCTVRN